MKFIVRLITVLILLIFAIFALLVIYPFYDTHLSLLFTDEWKNTQIDVNVLNRNASLYIPRILHQTWKDTNIPDNWKEPYEMCQQNLRHYQRMLWTDAKAEAFIKDEYPWFLNTFQSYPFNIQRADAIRYFVLYHYGGFYVDLDIGCRKSFDPLMYHKVILPKTNPIGFSNDW